ncbi:tetratricopeptide repeat protein [Mucilaginibacter achroorhodeus]|uniref:histidine kinase n=1 Tax=Mucilaginibacter achroorhodeus TaxID=2599294 RepID=A0A563U3R7_9SPHI|nr:ATP-binding protein [Mucilaginibacter achroorhodeus]TWR25998.1 tetratricopeptide repeat protein [Mucilaginibacter achroorhodeus]
MNTAARIFLLCVISILFALSANKGIAAIQKITPAADTNKIELYNKLVSRYRYDKPDSAVFYANLGLQLAKTTHNKKGQAVMLNQLGMIDDNVGEFESSRKKYLQALELYRIIGDSKGMATENIRLGVVELRKGQYDRSTGFFLTALELSQHIADKFGQMEAYITLGEAYAGQKKHDRALQYYHIAEKLNAGLPFSNLSLNLFNDIAISYRETGRLNEAKPYLLKGLKLSEVPKYQGLNITLTNTLASVYAKGGDTITSIKLQQAALAKARKINNYIRQIQTLMGLATTYGNINPAKSLAYWQEALQLSESRKAYKEQVDELNAIANIYELQRNYPEAYKARNRQYQIANEFYYKKMSRQIVSLQNAYELNQSKAREQQLRFDNNKRDLQQSISYGVIVAVFIILMVLVYFYFRTRKLNYLLNKTNAELKESNMVKDKLFSILGHDLRSPFISVINLLDIVDDDDLEPGQRKDLLNQLKNNTTVSLETLDSLLRWGQKQIKGIPINPSAFNGRDLVNKAATFLSGVAGNKDVVIENKVRENLSIFADPDHFEFIIRNLLSNAVKFSPQNSNVTITAEKHDDHKVSITVTDNGIGIASDKLDGIFDLGNISTRGTGNEKGTGLGLLLCREFAEANNGSITVSSRIGSGSSFTVNLPSA